MTAWRGFLWINAAVWSANLMLPELGFFEVSRADGQHAALMFSVFVVGTILAEMIHAQGNRK